VVDFSKAIIISGGIASGKSTAVSLLKISGFDIVDADIIAHNVLDNSLKEVEEAFGQSLESKGAADRKKIGDIVFKDSKKRELLESILHPKIKDGIFEECQRLEKKGVAYFVDIPLFFEKQDSYKEFKRRVLIYATKELQLQRLMKRDSLSKEEALLRLKAQMPIDEKKPLATKVVDNTKDLPHLQNEIDIITQWAKEI
jgi:dephospho-CoA kinase